MPTVIWILAVSLEAVLLVVAGGFLIAARSRTRHLRTRVHELETAAHEGRVLPRARRLVPRPDEAIKAVWETASLVREKGMGGAIRSSVNDLAGWAQVERPDLVELAGPDGRVAILFSDIEGSTSMNDKLGDRAWVRVLSVHDRVVRKQVERHGGQVVKTQGDGFMVAFGDPVGAVRCACGVQRSLDRGRRMGKAAILVRVGIHYGSVVHRENDIFGRNVAVAARVAALATGGEILISEPVAAAVSDIEDIALGDTRSVALKGFGGEYVVATVDWRA